MPTNIFIQNRSTLTLSVTVRQEGDRALTEGKHWTRGAAIVAPGRSERVAQFNRNRGITRKQIFYFFEVVSAEGQSIELKE